MTEKKIPSMSDVDGTEKGKVQLVSVRLVEPLDNDAQLMCQYFEEGEGEHDPWLQAQALQRGIEGDWPEHYWAIVGNWRAQYLKWRRHMRNMGLFEDDDLGPQQYLDTFKTAGV